MASFDAFKSTVGVALMEGAGYSPWTSDLGVVPDGGRAWIGAGPQGSRVVTIAPLADRDSIAVHSIGGLWQAEMLSQGMTAGVLILVGAAPRGGPVDVHLSSSTNDWQVWLVDLSENQLSRPIEASENAVRDGETRFQDVEAAVQSYFDGDDFKLSDLWEEERLHRAGRASFNEFLQQQTAIAAYVLVGIIVVLFFISSGLTLHMWSQSGTPVWNWGAAFAAVKNNSPVALVRLGSTLRPLIEQGELWRLMAANYLHAGLLHVFVNAYSVVALGPILEKIFGTPRFLAIWVVSGTCGALASSFVNPHAMSVGASGALFGLLGAMLSIGVQFRGAIPRHQTRAMRDVALIMLGINLILGVSIPNVDNTAHVGGLLGGLVMAFLLGPHPVLLSAQVQPPRRQAWLWIFPFLATAAILSGLVNAASGRIPDLVR